MFLKFSQLSRWIYSNINSKWLVVSVTSSIRDEKYIFQKKKENLYQCRMSVYIQQFLLTHVVTHLP